MHVYLAIIVFSPSGLQRDTMLLRQQTGAEAEGLHASDDARHCLLRQDNATVHLVASEEEGAVKAERDEEVCSGGPALHPGEARAPAGHGEGDKDAADLQEGGADSSPTRLRHGESYVRRR